MKLSRISKIIGKSESTLYDWKKKLENGTNILEHQSKKFSEKIDPKKKKAIVSAVQRGTAVTSLRKLSAKYKVSHTEICSTLNEKGFQYVKKIENDELDSDEEENRVGFCKDMLKYRGSKIKKTFFTDEMGIRLPDVSDTAKSWVNPGRKKIKTEKRVEDVKLNCWAGISWNGATSLHIFKTNLNNDIYQDIMEERAMEIEDAYGGKKVYFVQDNHPAHNNVDILDDFPNIEFF